MDRRIKPNEFYTIDFNNGTSDEDNGTTTKLINIATTIDEHATTRTNVDG
jgi:hypothetical protein